MTGKVWLTSDNEICEPSITCHFVLIDVVCLWDWEGKRFSTFKLWTAEARVHMNYILFDFVYAQNIIFFSFLLIW